MKTTKRRFAILSLVGLFVVLCFAYSFMPLWLRTPISNTPTTTVTPEPLTDFILACQEIALKVEQGDTLDSISVNYAVPKEYIKQYNRMKTDEVFPGMPLLIQMCSNMPTPTGTPKK